MKRQQILTSALVLGLLLALAVGLSLAQGPEPPEGEVNRVSEVEEAAAVGSKIPVQGRLTDASGNPINGTRTITFTLYDKSSGGVILCQDDDDVEITNGLFNAYMDFCTSSDINGRALYLGIQAEGDDEMEDRQAIYPVPYAFSLKPGAVISTTGYPALHVESTNSSGRALRAYASATSGTNYGVVGASKSPDGYGGYFYNDEGGTGVFGRGFVGGHFTTTTGFGSIGVIGEAGGGFGAGVKGVGNILSYGVWAVNDDNIALFVDGSGSGNAAQINGGDLYVDGNISASGSKAGYVVDFAQNAGKDVLEVGDVVVVTGYSDPILGQIPVMLVRKASDAGSTGVVGVVDRAVTFTSAQSPAGIEHEVLSAQGAEFQPLLAPQISTEEVPVSTGEYVSIVTLGAFHIVKVDASYGAIQPGDLLVSSSNPGYAMKATDPKPGTIIGKALGALESGIGNIPILVTLQ